MPIRTATPEDLSTLYQIGCTCFPPAEMVPAEEYANRLRIYPHHFWVMELDNGRLAGFLNGMVTDEPTIRDEMFLNADLHREHGAWQAIFGLAVLPQYQKHGYASRLMEHTIASARAQGRRGCILTCKQALIPYYKRFGYQDLGVSQSAYGGVIWHDMTLTF